MTTLAPIGSSCQYVEFLIPHNCKIFAILIANDSVCLGAKCKNFAGNSITKRKFKTDRVKVAFGD